MQKRAGVKLSQDVKIKYIDYMLAQTVHANSFNPHDHGPEWKSVIENPFLNLELLENVKAAGGKKAVLANQKRVQNALTRAYEIFSETKQSIIDVLEKEKQKNPSESLKFDNMIDRIETISMESTGGAVVSKMYCPGPNAFYSPSEHRFVLCPQILEMPESSLKAIIAHELGHSIDPCIVSGKLLEVEGTERPPGFENISKEQIIKMNEANGILMFEPELPKRKKIYTVDLAGMAAEILDSTYLTYTTKNTAPGVPFKSNPKQKTIACLSSSDSLGARQSAKKESLKNLESVIAEMEKQGATKESDGELRTLLKTKENFDTLYDEIGACSFLPGNSQLQEAWSDWLAGEVIGNDIEQETSESNKRQLAYESFGFFLATGCRSFVPNVAVKAKTLMKEMGCLKQGQNRLTDINAIIYSTNASQDSHSYSTDRVTKLFVAHPEIKKALGCGDKEGGKYCE